MQTLTEHQDQSSSADLIMEELSQTVRSDDTYQYLLECACHGFPRNRHYSQANDKRNNDDRPTRPFESVSADCFTAQSVHCV
ncbi:hypothetical protein E2C01_032889 [Portunus trituberculatus]|uniref:Uncharacterized protein n=1 Tax=Portunus trituberculatus TaxID=210409 RepID=A0A5B7F1Y1_PORTR|nr:hypothetical protein [Portunus trituberculatus]